MRIERIVPNLTVTDVPAAVGEHAAVLGLEVAMDHGWLVTLADGDGHRLSVTSMDAMAPVHPAVSVFVDDVREAYAAAIAARVEIVHALASEAWVVTRFLYRDAAGLVVNVGSHS